MFCKTDEPYFCICFCFGLIRAWWVSFVIIIKRRSGINPIPPTVKDRD